MNLRLIEENELRIHKIRTQLITFKDLVKQLDLNNITHENYVELEIAANLSKDFKDAITFNHLTVSNLKSLN
jgi:hypothetical protein